MNTQTGMKKDFEYREIPYNYTSFSDREIIQKYYDHETVEFLDTLRHQRITGRSARLLFETIGDYFIIDRNPYIFEDYLENKRKLRRLKKLHAKRIEIIEAASNGNELVLAVLRKTRDLDEDFFEQFNRVRRFRLRALFELGMATSRKNVHFDPFHRVAHVTDASDWRVEHPACVVYPDSVREIPGLVRAARKLGLAVIPRGGGTGLTGGAVPVLKNTLVINIEKLNAIGEIETVSENGVDIPVINVEAGAVTDDVIEHCAEHDFVFATDPTSAWASTIGGNIAENAGGKKCVIWGTAIDNIHSFRIVNADGDILEVKRRGHPYRKIRPDDTVVFDVSRIDRHGSTPVKTIELGGMDIRKKGLGKDITNKALGGLPGVQKEGGDGVIVDAKFVLYRHFAFSRTICLEFFGNNLINASRAIVDIMSAFESDRDVFLTALEHFDEKYVAAINYRNKSRRMEPPKAVLIVDVEGNDENRTVEAARRIIDIVSPYNTEAVTARNPEEAQQFWSDRKNLGAIARHTNAFKLNEDVVIPLDQLPAFADYIEKLNLKKELSNSVRAIALLEEMLARMREAPAGDFKDERIDSCRERLAAVRERYRAYLDALDGPVPAGEKPIFNRIQDGETAISFEEEVMGFLRLAFHGYDEIVEELRAAAEAERRRKIIIATHMHAGDGNVHVNIPVHSSDYLMLQEADETAADVMRQTVALGGVISGEHGIGLTKLRFIDGGILEEYARYKAENDPDNLFNPGKLTHDFPPSRIYTPSFNLLELEAFILKATDMEQLSMSMASCVRCGKCKSVCNTHYPRGTMFFNPRNKILGVALIAEAVLYDAQTSTTISFKNFIHLREISDHCTVCHKCSVPCPVKIDFGDITLSMREIMVHRKKARFKAATTFALYYLRKKGYYFNKIFGLLLYGFGYRAQRLAARINRPFRALTGRLVPRLGALLLSPLPPAGGKTLREVLGLSGSRQIYSFENPDLPVKKSVLYFPGCGPEISMAVIALLYNAGVRVVLPPEYLCCGYPFLTNGKTDLADMKSYENRVLLHRIADIVGYMDIGDVIVSCGTCYEMIKLYEVENIFKNALLTDISEFLAREGLYTQKPWSRPVLYHDPCHTPLAKLGYDKTFTALFGAKPVYVPYCCGEAGTLSLSTPHISATIRDRKAAEVEEKSEGMTRPRILTTCPSCVQGLERLKGVRADHLAVYSAEKLLGRGWKKDFLRKVKKRQPEEILL